MNTYAGFLSVTTVEQKAGGERLQIWSIGTRLRSNSPKTVNLDDLLSIAA